MQCPIRRPMMLALLLVAASAAQAANTEIRTGATLTPAEFPAFRAAVLEEMRSGESLTELSLQDRAEVQAILTRMEAELAKVDSVDRLNYDRRTALFNDQERLRVLLDQAREDSRLVCRRERITGSKMVRSICQTVAERRRETATAEDVTRILHTPGPKRSD